MFVDRVNGAITGAYARSQYDGQEEVPDDSADVAAFLQAINPAPTLRVSPLQMRMALRQMGIIAQVDAYVAQQDPNMQDAWQYASTMPITNPMVVAVATALNVDLKSLFQLAATFP